MVADAFVLLLPYLGWPLVVPLAGSSREWAAAVAAEVQAAARRRAVPLPETGRFLQALWVQSGLAALLRRRTASSFEDFEEGLRSTVYGGRGPWKWGPPLVVAGCPPAWEKFPECFRWLEEVGRDQVWRFTRSYHRLGLRRLEQLRERWTLQVVVENFHLQFSVQETMTLQMEARDFFLSIVIVARNRVGHLTERHFTLDAARWFWEGRRPVGFFVSILLTCPGARMAGARTALPEAPSPVHLTSICSSPGPTAEDSAFFCFPVTEFDDAVFRRPGTLRAEAFGVKRDRPRKKKTHSHDRP